MISLANTNQNTKDPSKPNYQNAAAQAMAKELEISRDVAGGFTDIHASKEVYIPQHSEETDTEYRIRSDRPVFFDAYATTLDGLTGIVFREDPTLNDDVNSQVMEHAEDIDLQGQHLDVFAKNVLRDALEAGHVGIFVDFPKVGSELSLGAEREAGARPYWSIIPKDDIVSWRTEVDEVGRVKLQQVVIFERSVEPMGEFGEEDVFRYHQYWVDGEIVNFKIWRQVKDDGREAFIVEDEGVITNQTEIPLAMAYGERTALMESRPPLVDLARLNILHLQTSSDYYHAMHMANVPMMVIKGGSATDFVISPNSSVSVDAEGDVKWVESSGSALTVTRVALQDIESQMAAMGLSMLKRETRGAETAEAKRLDRAQQDSKLATVARSVQDALENALKFHANYMRIDEPGTVAINREFGALDLGADEQGRLIEMVEKGQLRVETMWGIMAENGKLPDTFDADIEKDGIESDMGTVTGFVVAPVEGEV